MLLKLRSDLVKDHQTESMLTLAMKGWALAMTSPALYAISGAAAQTSTRALAGATGTVRNLPGLLGHWTRNRDFPQFAPKSFHQLWRERQAIHNG